MVRARGGGARGAPRPRGRDRAGGAGARSGRITASHDRASTLDQTHEHTRYLYCGNDAATELCATTCILGRIRRDSGAHPRRARRFTRRVTHPMLGPPPTAAGPVAHVPSVDSRGACRPQGARITTWGDGCGVTGAVAPGGPGLRSLAAARPMGLGTPAPFAGSVCGERQI